MGIHRLQAEKIAHPQTGGYAYGATQSDSNMRQITANALASLIYLDSRYRIRTAERCVANSAAYPVGYGGDLSIAGFVPGYDFRGHLAKTVRLTIAARQQEAERVVRQL